MSFKEESQYLEKADTSSDLAADGSGIYEGVAFTEKDARAARLRIDLILVTTITFYYFMNFLDRSNLGNAKVAGMEKDLGMTGWDYNIAISVYFVPYIIFEFPVTLMLKRAGPDRLLPTLVGAWGIVTMAQGWLKSYGGLLACRFFLGILESGLTPCSVVLLSMYIRRYDLQKRVAVFFAMISLASAFAGLLAYGITSKLNGAHEHAGWRWIFWLEGGGTVVGALLTWPLIPRSPTKAWWLSARQKAALLHSLEVDNMAYVEAKEEKGLFKSVNVFWTNPCSWAVCVISATSGFFNSGLPYFIPSIVKGLGYTAVRAQLFTVPPYACGFAFALTSAVIGDRIRMRSPILFVAGIFATIGYSGLFLIVHSEKKIAKMPYFTVINFTSNSPVKRYVALFFIISGGNMTSSAVQAWGLNNASGHVRRAATLVGGVMCSSFVGLASVWAFSAKQAPHYIAGSDLGMVASVLTVVVPPIAAMNLFRINRNRARELATHTADHIYPPGKVIVDQDVRFRFTY